MSQNAIHPVSFKTNVVNAQQIQERDCARAKHFKAGHHPHGPCAKKHHSGCPDPSTTISVTNAAVTYTMPVGFGNPATTCDLLIDTGSSNTWVLKPPYKETSTCKDTRKPFAITYAWGLQRQRIHRPSHSRPNLVIKDQSIGVACIGPSTLPRECIGIYYEPTTTANAQTGSLSFGGPDRTKCTGEINYVPITRRRRMRILGYDQASYAERNHGHTPASQTPERPSLWFQPNIQRLQAATGASVTRRPDFYRDRATYECMQSMIFTINGINTSSPRTVKSGHDMAKCLTQACAASVRLFLLFQRKLTPTAVDGYTFLQRFYSVYDTTNCQIGFATPSTPWRPPTEGPSRTISTV
ncbi:aspartic peptidase domain-containing protein [Mycena leptocephala]|nr:aspartic peptidase domain-containing protein [Mycena leptocephala]